MIRSIRTRQRVACSALLGLFACSCAIVLAVQPAYGQMRVRDICRVKGQEPNTLHGLGLVVGLDGTGDSETPTMTALAKTLELMGTPLRSNAGGQASLDDLKNTKNVALVMVTATVPPEGARQGDQLACQVNALSAKSLLGGRLMMTPLVGPRPDNPTIYAICEGSISLDQRGPVTNGSVAGGCRMEQDVTNHFVQDGKITLILDSAHASFQNSFEVQSALVDSTGGMEFDARAIDQLNIEVTVSEQYRDDPVAFTTVVLDTRVFPGEPEARVVIDKRNGVVVVGKNVMIARVAVSHNNIGVQTGNAPSDSFVILPEDQETTATRLEALVNSLNALKVSTNDIIAIIENLKESRALYGRLIVR